MHDSLPDELVLLVLEAIATPARNPAEYDLRLKSLSVLSRVARRYSQLARPLLWQEMRASKRSHLERVRHFERHPSLSAATKLFQVSTGGARYDDEGAPVSPNEGVEASAAFPRIEDIRIECIRSPLDLPLLGVHTGLRRLSLVNVDLGASSPVSLPQLEQLRLERTIIPSALLTEWLDSAHLPSLKAVRLVAVYSALHAGAPSLHLSPAFLAQVDFVQTPGMSLEAMRDFAHSVNPPFLFASSLASLLPRHLILAPHQFEGVARATTTLRKVGAQVAKAPKLEDEAQHPCVILLPRALEALAAEDCRVEAALGPFVATCAERKARVIWHSEGENAASERDLVSREFWRYARELKAERALDRVR